MSSNGLEYLAGLRLGYPEVEWSQVERLERLQDLALGLVAPQEYGWSMRWAADLTQDVGWRVRNKAGGLMQLQMQPGIQSGPSAPFDLGAYRRAANRPYMAGLDQLGRPMLFPLEGGDILDAAGAAITVPDDGVWRTLVAKHALTAREPGTLTLTAGSVTVTGVNTQFSRLTSDADPRAMLLRIASADTAAGNEGFYRVATIIDDNNLTLATPPPATESNVPFRVQGEFFGAAPADPDIHRTPIVVWELVDRAVMPPGDGLIYADVMYNSATDAAVQFIDRRQAQTIRRRNINLAGMMLTAPDADPTWLIQWGAAVEAIEFVAAAGCRSGSTTDAGNAIGNDVGAVGQLLVLARDDGAGGHEVVARERIPFAFSSVAGPDHVSTEALIWNATSPNGLTGMDLIALPHNYSSTHALFYTDDTGSLLVRRSSDHGLAGSWGSAATILNPAGSDTVQRPRAILTRLTRIVVVFEYYDATAGDISIRFVYSDDYGATWETNSGDAYTIRNEAGTDLVHPDIAEDDDGQIWTAWKRGNDEIRLMKGQGLNDPTPAGLTAQQPLRGFIVSRQATAAAARTTTAGRPCLLPGPNGILVLYQECVTATGVSVLYQSWVANGRVMRVTKVSADSVNELGAPGEGYADMVVHPMPGGFVSLVHCDSPATAYSWRDYPVIPLYRDLSWFEGR